MPSKPSRPNVGSKRLKSGNKIVATLPTKTPKAAKSSGPKRGGKKY